MPYKGKLRNKITTRLGPITNYLDSAYVEQNFTKRRFRGYLRVRVYQGPMYKVVPNPINKEISSIVQLHYENKLYSSYTDYYASKYMLQ